MVSGATNFTGASTKHLLSTEIFPDFIYLYRRADKKNKISKPLDLGILRAGSGSGRAKKSPVFFLAARARPDPVAGP